MFNGSALDNTLFIFYFSMLISILQSRPVSTVLSIIFCNPSLSFANTSKSSAYLTIVILLPRILKSHLSSCASLASHSSQKLMRVQNLPISILLVSSRLTLILCCTCRFPFIHRFLESILIVVTIFTNFFHFTWSKVFFQSTKKWYTFALISKSFLKVILICSLRSPVPFPPISSY